MNNKQKSLHILKTHNVKGVSERADWKKKNNVYPSFPFKFGLNAFQSEWCHSFPVLSCSVKKFKIVMPAFFQAQPNKVSYFAFHLIFHRF